MFFLKKIKQNTIPHSLSKRGFTLIELMVSMTIFSIVMTMSAGAIYSVLSANRKSQSLRSVLDNLNFTMEGMTRTIRFGENYHCGSGGSFALPADCHSGMDSITVLSSTGQLVTYKLSGGRIARSINGSVDYYLTSADVTIQTLTFRVFGSNPYAYPDFSQPQAIIVVSGYVGNQPNTKSSFSLETTVSQRKLDFQ